MGLHRAHIPAGFDVSFRLGCAVLGVPVDGVRVFLKVYTADPNCESCANRNSSLNSLKGGYIGNSIGDFPRGYKGGC